MNTQVNKECNPNTCTNYYNSTAQIETKKTTSGPENKQSQVISPTEALALIKANQGTGNLVILDVSTKREYLKWHVKNAVNINFLSLSFMDRIKALDRNKTYIVYCKLGGRSNMAQKAMNKNGFREVYNMAGGRDRWLSENTAGGVGLARASGFTLRPVTLTVRLITAIRKIFHSSGDSAGQRS